MFKKMVKYSLMMCLGFCVLGSVSLDAMQHAEDARLLGAVGTISLCSGIVVTGLGIWALYGAYSILSKTDFSLLQEKDKSKSRTLMRIGGGVLLGILGYKVTRSGLQLLLGGGVILAGNAFMPRHL